MAATTTGVPWIDDQPGIWEMLRITIDGRTFEFLAQWRGGVDTKIDQRRSINKSGAKTTTRGSHGLEADFQLLLWQASDLASYTALVPKLLARAAGKTIGPVQMDHPVLRLFKVKRGMYPKHVGAPERRSTKEPLTASLKFIEHLPPTDSKKKSDGNLDRTNNGPGQGLIKNFDPGLETPSQSLQSTPEQEKNFSAPNDAPPVVGESELYGASLDEG